MNKDKFSAILSLLIPQIAKEYMERTNEKQESAIIKIYSSKLYEMLEKEETKMWHFSPEMLCDILQNELQGEEIIIPIEG